MVCRLHLSIRSARIWRPMPLSKSTLSGSTTAARPPGSQAAVDVLQKAELLVAGREGEVGARGQPAALLGAEGRVGEDQRRLGQGLALGAEGVAVADTPEPDPSGGRSRCRGASGSSARAGGCPGHAPCRRRWCGGTCAAGSRSSRPGRLFVIGLAHVVVGGDQEAAGAGGRVLDDVR